MPVDIFLILMCQNSVDYISIEIGGLLLQTNVTNQYYQKIWQFSQMVKVNIQVQKIYIINTFIS